MNVHQLKKDICEIGQRIYNKGFAAANDGNITLRISDNEVLCTPTMICKGFMKPDDICIVDMEGKQLSGRRKRTSEMLLHLAIMKERPDVKAASIAIRRTRRPLPSRASRSPMRPARGRGLSRRRADHEIRDAGRPEVRRHGVAVRQEVERHHPGQSRNGQLWRVARAGLLVDRILDAYCRILMLSKQLGRVTFFTPEKTRELLDLKQKWGFSDARLEAGMENCDICANDVFRDSWQSSGVERRAFEAAPVAPRFAGPAKPPTQRCPRRERSRRADPGDYGSRPGGACKVTIKTACPQGRGWVRSEHVTPVDC